MKKIIKLGMAALTALTMAGCSSKSEDVKTITVGISPDYAPYESENKKGDIIGFDPDMMKCFEEYLSDEEGVTYKLEMKKMDFDNIITQLQGDQIDVGISGFTYDSKRKVEWSDPYLGSSQVAVIPKDSDIASTADLEGKSLVAQTGATGEAAAKEVKDAKVKRFKNASSLLLVPVSSIIRQSSSTSTIFALKISATEIISPRCEASALNFTMISSLQTDSFSFSILMSTTSSSLRSCFSI